MLWIIRKKKLNVKEESTNPYFPYRSKKYFELGDKGIRLGRS